MNDFTDSELEDKPFDYQSLLADALTAICTVALCAVLAWWLAPMWLPLMRWVFL
jgi:hypothetical protein